MTIAVFTKNLTNPAYEAFRIASDQIARITGTQIVHYVPKQPDNVDEQNTMVDQVLKDRPDAVIFIPVDDVAMIESVKKLNEAKIPVILVSNPLPGSFVTYVGADDFEIGYREARYLFENLGSKGKIVVIEGTPAAPTNRERVRGYRRAFAEFPDIEVLGSGVGNYQQPDARRAMDLRWFDASSYRHATGISRIHGMPQDLKAREAIISHQRMCGYQPQISSTSGAEYLVLPDPFMRAPPSL
jgi:ribose transport system substrate-binding protein